MRCHIVDVFANCLLHNQAINDSASLAVLEPIKTARLDYRLSSILCVAGSSWWLHRKLLPRVLYTSFGWASGQCYEMYHTFHHLLDDCSLGLKSRVVIFAYLTLVVLTLTLYAIDDNSKMSDTLIKILSCQFNVKHGVARLSTPRTIPTGGTGRQHALGRQLSIVD